jgi:hypothetical protein
VRVGDDVGLKGMVQEEFAVAGVVILLNRQADLAQVGLAPDTVGGCPDPLDSGQ